MGGKLPKITAKEIITVLEKAGFALVRQSGSHKIYKSADNKRATIPFHSGKILHPKVLKSILKDAAITIEKLKEGYIAITSAIIISFLLMTIVFTLSSASFFSRSNTLDANQKETSLGLAEACADTALLKLAQNSSYAGNENINIGGNSCSILALESPSGQKIIKTWADYKGYRTNIKITMNHPAMTMISWEELPNF